MLSFTTYHLLKNPEAWQKAQQEVDSVIGKGQVKYEHLAKLPYLEAVLREALRLQPTAPAFSVKAAPGTQGHVILGGEYTIPADATIVVILPVLHSDPMVYGDDAKAFKPERMLADNFTNLPPNAWKVSPAFARVFSKLTYSSHLETAPEVASDDLSPGRRPY